MFLLKFIETGLVVRFQVCLDSDIVEELKILALKNYRSMSKEIVVHLERFFIRHSTIQNINTPLFNDAFKKKVAIFYIDKASDLYNNLIKFKNELEKQHFVSISMSKFIRYILLHSFKPQIFKSNQ